MSVLLSFDLGERLARLSLSRPEAKNALRPLDWQAMRGHLEDLARHQEVRALLVSGVAGAFCAGGDVKTMPERLAMPPADRQRQLEQDGRVVLLLQKLAIPVVAAVSGPCMGAGLSLLLACDLRIAAESASFGAPFHRLGLSCDFGLSWLLSRTVGHGRAMHLLFSDRPLDAQQALAWGLVSEVVPDAQLDDHVRSLCDRLVHGPRQAHTATKQAVVQSPQHGLQAALVWEAHAQSLLGHTEDAQEGVRARLEKRPPRFR